MRPWQGGQQNTVPWWMDAVVFSKIKERLGGRVRLIIRYLRIVCAIAMAPSLRATATAERRRSRRNCTSFSRFAFARRSCRLRRIGAERALLILVRLPQGYGLSETCAVTSLSDESLWGRAEGHVGYPAPENEIVLESVPDMNYTVHDHPRPRYGVCPLPRRTQDCADWRRAQRRDSHSRPKCVCRLLSRAREDGRSLHGRRLLPHVRVAQAALFCVLNALRSGDVGQWNANGTLSIIDRKKNIFKLAQVFVMMLHWPCMRALTCTTHGRASTWQWRSSNKSTCARPMWHR